MRVEVDRDRCTGLGLCESIAPEFFGIQDDGTLSQLRDEADAEQRELLEEAVRSCPTQALQIRD